jgi:hypothetical protein
LYISNNQFNISHIIEDGIVGGECGDPEDVFPVDTIAVLAMDLVVVRK